jgi:archaellum component FlaC
MALDDWANDVRDVEGEDPQALRSRALRGRVAELESLRELTIPDIRRFYGQEDEASNEGN